MSADEVRKVRLSNQLCPNVGLMTPFPTKERNEILFLKRNLRSLLLFFPLDHLLVQYSNSFCFHTKLEQDQKLLICTPFACAMVFSDAFALMLFMLMNKLQHYSFIESLRFQGA